MRSMMAFALRRGTAVLLPAVLCAMAALGGRADALPGPGKPLPLDCHVKGSCPVPAAAVTAVGPTVDEPLSHALVTVTGTGLDNATTLRIGDIAYSEYQCPKLPAKLKQTIARTATATACDPASPQDLKGLQFAVYDGGKEIMAPDPLSAREEGAGVTLPPPGSTVSVTVDVDGDTMPSQAAYSFPIGTMTMQGPLPWQGIVDDGYDPPLGGRQWVPGDGYNLSVTVPRATSGLTFTTTSPDLHVFATFTDSGNAERQPPANDINGVELPSQPPWVVGTSGTYTAEVFWCKPDSGSVQSAGPAPCKDWQQVPGQWTPVALRTVRLTKPPGVHENQQVAADMAFPLGAAFSPTQLAGTFEVVTSAFETDPSTCPANPSGAADTACGAGPAGNLPSDGESCLQREPQTNLQVPSDVFIGLNPGTLQRVACATSAPFNVVVAPAAYLQLSAVPYTILYFPPGDASNSKLTLGYNFGTNLSLSNSSTQANSATTSSSGSTAFSLGVSYGGVGYNFGSTGGWSTSDMAGFGETTGAGSQSSNTVSVSLSMTRGPDQNLVPGSGDLCASATDCTAANEIRATDQYASEPFWHDLYVLEVHPQFAVYDVGSGPAEYVQRGADPDTADITVADLDGCAHAVDTGNSDPCTIDATTDGLTFKGGVANVQTAGTITLTPADAASLLTLDPFYGGGQAAPVMLSRGVRIGGGPYGSVFDNSHGGATTPQPVMDDPTPFGPMLTNTLAGMQSQTGSQTTSTSVTNVVSNSESAGLTLGLSSGDAKGSNSITLQNGDSRSTTQSMSTTFGDSTAVSNALVSMDTATINDIDNTSPTGSCSKCHNPVPTPPNVAVFLDRQFGSFMFQDAGAPGPPPGGLTRSQIGGILLEQLTGNATAGSGLSDVPASSSQRDAIAAVVGLNLLSSSAGAFHPASPFTQSQLASAFAALFHVADTSARQRFTDARANATSAVTGSQLAIALQSALGVDAAAAQKLVAAATTTFKGSAALTRGQAAVVLAGAVSQDCLTGCKPPAAKAPAAKKE